MEEFTMKTRQFKNIRHGVCLVLICVCIGFSISMISGCRSSNNGELTGPESNGEIPDELTIDYISGDSGQCFVSEATFSIVLQIRNTSGNSITYSLPAGIQFIPNSADAQTMMLLQIYTITIEPGATQTICLPVYCLNADLDAPSADYTFSLGDIVTSSCLKEIVNLTAGKTIDFTEAFSIQLIIWDCVNSGSISAEERSYLENL